MFSRKVLLLSIILLGVFLRFWNIGQRWILTEENARILVGARYGASNGLLSVFDPEKWYLILLGQSVRTDLAVYAPWAVLAVFGVATIYIFYLLGSRLINSNFGLACAMVAAASSQLIFMPMELNMGVISLFCISIGLYLLAKKDWKSILFLGYGMSLHGNTSKHMGLFLFNSKEAGIALALFFIALLAILKIKKLDLYKKELFITIIVSCALGTINPVAWCVLPIIILGFCIHCVVGLLENKELLLWIGIGFFGFWMFQNSEVVGFTSKNEVFLEAKRFIDNKIGDKIRFNEFDSSAASVIPVMYLYQQEGRLSEEGLPVAILHDSGQIQVYLWRKEIESYTRGVSASDVFLKRY